MTSRYSTKPGAIFKRESLTYYVLSENPLQLGFIFRAFDSSTSAHLATAETLEELESKCQFIGYRPDRDNSKQKETK